MTSDTNEQSTFFQRYHLDRKLTIAISFFAVAGLILIVLSNLATNTMASLRAYSTFQGNWTRERESAAFHLYRYIDEGSKESLRKFNESISFIRNATKARDLMEQKEINYAAVRGLLLKTGAHPEDIPDMIQTYVWLHDFRYFETVVNLWEKSDRYVYKMDTLAHKIKKQWSSEDIPSEQMREIMKRRVRRLDRKLSEAQIGINNMLGQGVRLLETITFWSTAGVGLLLLIIGFLFTYRFRRSIRKWRRSLIRSQKRYRSLFDNNPNAVFSMDSQGRFVSGNQALEEMTGYSSKELREMTYLPLVRSDYRDYVEECFAEALNGNPKSYESVGVHRNGEEYEVYVTNLPIIVDGQIEGVYGIAQDITEQKKAKRRLEKSLKEKKTLLAEIHHRVKNNLAIISGLLELQADGMAENDLKYDLLNTQSRIHSMAMVHEKLYNSDSLSRIEMPPYIQDLVDSIRQTMNTDTVIHFDYDFGDVKLDITQAIPCGLLLNEMVVNAFKYAFEERDQGTIGIQMKQVGETVYMRIYDDGVGLPEDIDINTTSSLGLTLINTLTQQLEGTLEVDRSSGTDYQLSFSVREAGFLQTE